MRGVKGTQEERKGGDERKAKFQEDEDEKVRFGEK